MASYCCFFRYILLIVYITDRARSTNVINCDENNCQNTTINCISDQDCFISCNSSFICQYSVINCPQNHECMVSCDNINSCKGLTINAQSASTLDIAGCTKNESCINMIIYCPQHTTNDQTNCLIEGNDNLNGINIYAVNGWNDIDIDYNTTSYNNNIKGKIYCSKDTSYDTSCIIGWDNLSCIEDNNYCNTLQVATTGNDNKSTQKQLDAEMMIIIVTLIVSICLIAACCWYTIKTNKSNNHGMESTINNNNKYTTSNNNIADNNDYYDNNNNNNHHHISSTNRIHQTFTTHSIKSTTDIIKPISVKSVSAQSTVPTISVDIATDVDIASNGSAEPEPEMNHNQNEQKIEEEEEEEEEEENEKQFEEESMAEYNGLNVINENDENVSALNVESFAVSVEEKKKIGLKANVSESESTMMKSPDTWDNFEKDNGILGDKYMMVQMMGYLEEGAICCSLE